MTCNCALCKHLKYEPKIKYFICEENNNIYYSLEDAQIYSPTHCSSYEPRVIDPEDSLSIKEIELLDFLYRVNAPIVISSLPIQYIGAVGPLNSKGLVRISNASIWSSEKDKKYRIVKRVKVVYANEI